MNVNFDERIQRAQALAQKFRAPAEGPELDRVERADLAELAGLLAECLELVKHVKRQTLGISPEDARRSWPPRVGQRNVLP